MTDSQRELFSEIVDLNFEISEAESIILHKKYELNSKLNDLKGSMGDEEYNKFMNKGKAMFAPIS